MAGAIASLPMYFPDAPFALADAVSCASFVDSAYDQCAQWVAQSYPRRGSFVWTQPTNPPGITYTGPFFWTFDWLGTTYDEPFGFIAQAANGDVFLALRGTVTDADEYQDLRLDQTPFALTSGYGNVHAGFYTIYQSLSAQVTATLKGLPGLGRLLFAGHSLGSGLSSLAVADVVGNGGLPGAPTMLYINLASPRVGDPTFAAAMNGGPVLTYRIVNTEDIVPDAPTAIIGSYLYKHFGTTVDFTAQYGSIGDNHSLEISYIYALANPAAPQGPPPAGALPVAGPVRRSARQVALGRPVV
jgi:triacylglycerol lipase